MKESISNAMVFTIIIIFVAIILVLLVGSISFSKAFKAKNRIVEIVEKANANKVAVGSAQVKQEIEDFLASSGYPVNVRRNECKELSDTSRADIDLITDISSITDTTNYFYCIYPYKTDRGNYYRVVVYMSFDLPVIGGVLQFPVSGETKIDLNPIAPNSGYSDEDEEDDFFKRTGTIKEWKYECYRCQSLSANLR